MLNSLPNVYRFIFTLVAMTASLVALANTNDLDFNSVVINFGLALTTTIIGLIVRIMWLQLDSQSLSDAESLMKDRIIKQTKSLGEESDNIVTKMTALSSEMEKASSDLKKNFDSLTKSYWPNIIISPKNKNTYLHRLNKYGKCIKFGKRKNLFNNYFLNV